MLSRVLTGCHHSIISLNDLNVRCSETTLTGRQEEAKWQRRQSPEIRSTRNSEEAEAKTKKDGSSGRCNNLLHQAHLVGTALRSRLQPAGPLSISHPYHIVFCHGANAQIPPSLEISSIPYLPTSLLILELSLHFIFSADLSCYVTCHPPITYSHNTMYERSSVYSA